LTTAACAYADERGKVTVISDWPDRTSAHATREKVPTEIGYGDDEPVYGFSIKQDTDRISWIKLALEKRATGEAKNIHEQDAQILKKHGMPEKSAVDVSSDFLRYMRLRLLENFEIHYGNALWQTSEVALVVTFPAVWSDSAKEKTLEAVSRAGFNDKEFPQLKQILTVTEPEAAALHTLEGYWNTPTMEHIAMDDAFLVCDMGGGTVDLISYVIKEMNPLVLEELTVGTGGQCGSSFLEREFMRVVANKLGLRYFRAISGGLSASQVSFTCLPTGLGKIIRGFTARKEPFNGTSGIGIPLTRSLLKQLDGFDGIDDEDQLPISR
jgi:hypothetical protein